MYFRIPRTIKTPHIDLTYKKIIKIDEGIIFPNTNLINIANNRLKNIAGVNWPKCNISLDFEHNKIDTLNGANFPEKLHGLKLRYNKLNDISSIIFPENTICLDFSHNLITSLQNVLIPANLLFLNLSHNKINGLEFINFPKKMKEINLSYCKLSSLNGVIFPEDCEKINLSHNNFETLSGSNLPVKIKLLDLSRNKFSQIETDFLSRSLEVLNYKKNCIETIPSFEQFVHLEDLILSRNKIAYVPNTFPNKLRRLYLDNNVITKVDLHNTNLIFINLEDNLLEEITQNYSTKLKILILSFNKLKKINENMLCKNLERLLVAGNEISVDFNLEEFNRMKILFICFNPFTSLDSCKFPKNLQVLRCKIYTLETFPNNLPESLDEIHFPETIYSIMPTKYMHYILLPETIYESTQSVHNVTVEKNIKTSIKKIINDSENLPLQPINEIISELGFSNEIEINNTTMDVGITEEKIIRRIYAIIKHNNYDGAIDILKDAIQENNINKTCNTGKVSILVNVLTGIHDGIEIKIGLVDDINNTIEVIKKRKGKKEDLVAALQEKKYEESVITLWASYYAEYIEYEINLEDNEEAECNEAVEEVEFNEAVKEAEPDESDDDFKEEDYDTDGSN